MVLPSYITFNPISGISTLLEKRQIAVLVDENTREHCYPLLKPYLPNDTLLIQIASGEKNKTLQTCTQIWAALTDHHFDRKGLLINLGGGVIGDMGGFCASTYKRGIDFIQMPTTLLSQVDASVGGKLGVDFNGFKNHIGLFRQPHKVWIHTKFLETLPPNELYSGFAEVIKHTLISDGNAFDKLLSTPFEDTDWEATINHSVRLKAKVTEEDPFEKGYRKILNFGHTIGHAIESYFLENYPQAAFLHGEAIAIGMLAEAYFSHQKDFLSESELEVLSSYLIRNYTDVVKRFEEKINDNEGEKIIRGIIEWARQDKKNANRQILTVALKGIGKAIYDVEITPKEIENSLYHLSSFATKK